MATTTETPGLHAPDAGDFGYGDTADSTLFAHREVPVASPAEPSYRATPDRRPPVPVSITPLDRGAAASLAGGF